MYHKKNNLLPEKSKIEVFEEYLGKLGTDTFIKLQNFQNCNENEFMQNEINNEICPVCGRQFNEEDKTALHHKTYEKLCFYKKLDCKRCSKNHPEEFEECKNHLIRIHQNCHTSIHGYEIKNLDKEN